MLTVLFYHDSSFLIIDLYLLISAVIVQIFSPIVELVLPIGIPTKETKAEMKTHPVTVEINTSGHSV